LACSSQYGLPGTEVSSQKRNVLVPGSPIGQQQEGAERLEWIDADGITGRGCGGRTAVGVAAGSGPMTAGGRIGCTFDGGGGAEAPPALASGGKVGPAALG